MYRLCAVLLLGFLSAAGVLSATKLTYVDLVKHLTDLEQLAVLPAPGERCAQSSSYDRKSKYDETTGQYTDWFANGDGGGIIRTEGEVSVLAEMEGPGCIRRIWSATAGSGHVKIYLDGATEPAVDLPFIDYFSQKQAPFTYPGLVYKTAANGFDNYVPIPFKKSCKIVAEKGWGNYYHFTYTTFPKDTEVPTFTRDLTPEELTALGNADTLLRGKLGGDPSGPRKGEEMVNKQLTLAPGSTTDVAHLKGAKAITGMLVKLNTAGLADVESTLREVTLHIRWDGEKDPSVWTPLGDFFGTAPGINKYTALPLGMTDDGFYSYWYMPFAKEAQVEVSNDGKTPVSLEFRLTTAPLTRPAAELGRFHAKWHRDAFGYTTPDRAIDWPMVKTTGRGRYVGVMLHIWNPVGGWWGEGDEKFFVDGEKFPSTFGTGSEDFFGYAWSSGRLFYQAFHNQTRNAGNCVGQISVNRFQIADNVPFQTSFEGDIEKYYKNSRPTLYACTAYWYQTGGVDPYQPVPVTEREGYYVQPYLVNGVLEGENLKVLVKAGAPGQQSMDNWPGQWSNATQLFWTQTKIGDRLVLAVPVKDAGRYDIQAQFTKAGDYGIVQLYLDEEKLGDPIDLYNQGVIPSGEIKLGTRELTAGEHKLTLEIVGANEKAAKSYLVGLDYLKLTPVK
ncbi:MAG TPA: DUF2961 domain-containing protein [Armatimonadota bacterium]|jgi:hypothetical protein